MLSNGADLFFVKLQRQSVGVGEEGEAPVGIFVHPHGLARHAMAFEPGDLRIQVADGKGKVAQATGFRARGARWRIGEGEKLDLRRRSQLAPGRKEESRAHAVRRGPHTCHKTPSTRLAVMSRRAAGKPSAAAS